MLARIKTFLELIKFEHTAFALPFAYLGMITARESWPSLGIFLWVTAAMVGARTAAMCLNRVIDLGIDARNPRTKNRPTVTAQISVPAALGASAAAIALFFFSAWRLNPLCLKLAPVALIFLVGYHYVKRFSFLSHFVLGLTLGMAPVAGWIAVTGALSWKPFLPGLAVLFWVAGFDIIYALLDMDFDRAYGLYSVPAQFGRERALEISRYCHVATVFFLSLFGLLLGFGVIYWVGLAVVAGLLKLEHTLVGEGDLDQINTAFFNINGWIGILLLIFTFLEIYR